MVVMDPNTYRATERMKRLAGKPVPPVDDNTRALIEDTLGAERFESMKKNGLTVMEVISVQTHAQSVDDIKAVLGEERLATLQEERRARIRATAGAVAFEDVMTGEERKKLQAYIDGFGETKRPQSVVDFRGVNVTERAKPYVDVARPEPHLGKEPTVPYRR
jgi:hypothetical protein